MKAAIFIKEGRTQVVLTPESQLESSVLEQIHEAEGELHTTRGEFYDCKGGYTRQGKATTDLIFVMDTKQ